MATLKQIKDKMGTVKNVRKITRTMEAVSLSKMKRAMNAALQTREYASLGLALLKGLAEKDLRHELLEPGTKDVKTLVVLMSSNKGLCGGFNMSVARSAWKYIQAHDDVEKPAFITVGKHSETFVRKTGEPLVAAFNRVVENGDPDEVRGLSELVLDEFRTGMYARVILVYADFISALTYKPTVRKILPVQEKIVRNMLESTGEGFESEKQSGRARYVFEPGEEEVLNVVLEKLVGVMVYQAVLESLASEHSARRIAMKSATDNAGAMFDALLLGYNRARQAAITQEISEISAGAEALL